MARETVAMDGKSLRGSYEAISDDPRVEPHPAILLVSAYIVERGLILEPDEVASKTNEITAIPAFIHQMAAILPSIYIETMALRIWRKLNVWRVLD